MQLTLCTLTTPMAEAWRHCFSREPAVAVVLGDILAQPGDAILSPANSFGFMAGGIDLLYRRHFGTQLEARLQAAIRTACAGELLVGQALVVATGQHPIRFMVSAPTMRVPGPIAATVNVYLAFRAALRAVLEHPIERLLVPALGAGSGGMPPLRVARQMHAAYREVIHHEVAWRHSEPGVRAHHAALLE